MNIGSIIFGIGFFVMTVFSLWINEDWSDFVEKQNREWFELSSRQINEWANFCRKLEKERDELRARVRELEGGTE